MKSGGWEIGWCWRRDESKWDGRKRKEKKTGRRGRATGGWGARHRRMAGPSPGAARPGVHIRDRDVIPGEVPAA